MLYQYLATNHVSIQEKTGRRGDDCGNTSVPGGQEGPEEINTPLSELVQLIKVIS